MFPRIRVRTLANDLFNEPFVLSSHSFGSILFEFPACSRFLQIILIDFNPVVKPLRFFYFHNTPPKEEHRDNEIRYRVAARLLPEKLSVSMKIEVSRSTNSGLRSFNILTYCFFINKKMRNSCLLICLSGRLTLNRLAGQITSREGCLQIVASCLAIEIQNFS